MVLALLVSALISVSVYFVLYYAGDALYNNFLKNDCDAFVEKENEKCLDKFEKYVSQNNIKSSDEDKISEFTDSSRTYLVIAVYKDGKMLYSPVSDVYAEDEVAFSELYAGESVRTVTFSDTSATVHLYGFFDYRFYTYSTIFNIIVSLIVFLSIFVGFIQRKIRYIQALENDIKILETGGLDHIIEVKGRDELSSLAEELNIMRLSLSENISKQDEAVKANYKLVVSVAHDLRTPLTALLLYLDLLKKGGYTKAEEKSYIDKSHFKAIQIKNMTDSLFERFLISRDSKVTPSLPQSVQYLFEDVLSDVTSVLTSMNFEVVCDVNWPEKKISVVTDYVRRISDNICSNMQKYADNSQPVSLTVKEHDEKLLIRFSNKVAPLSSKTESYGVGVDNIKIMMNKMGGECIVSQDDETYTISLLFDFYKRQS